MPKKKKKKKRRFLWGITIAELIFNNSVFDEPFREENFRKHEEE